MNSITRFFFVLLIVSSIMSACRQNEHVEEEFPEPPAAATPTVPSDTTSFGYRDTMLGSLYAGVFDAPRDERFRLVDSFTIQLLEVLADSSSISYPFDSITSSIVRTVTSDDRRVRMFCWGHPGHGTLTNASVVVQWRTEDGRYRLEDWDDQKANNEFMPMPWKLWHLSDSLYLLIEGGQLMLGMPYTMTACYAFTDSSSSSTAVQFELEDEMVSSISLDKNWYLDHLDESRSIPELMKYDPNRKILTFPEIVDTSNGHFYNNVSGTGNIVPSGNTIRLRFNGADFVSDN